jgi:dihydropteroate synthase
MAVVNLTPDSFYAGSRFQSVDSALQAAVIALTNGADVLDLGAESTRPGSSPVSQEEEQQRLLPVLTELRSRYPEALLSVDTRHASTARAALAAGADIINDVTGLRDSEMSKLMAESECGLVLMHLRGEFGTMHRLEPLRDPVGFVFEGLRSALQKAGETGVAPERIVVDPGFGFGKNLDENFPLLAHLNNLAELGRPILAGVSRKSFIGHVLGGVAPEDRLYGTIAAATAAILNGAHILRVHDVKPAVDAARIADAVLAAS